jgi:hypothetical protein
MKINSSFVEVFVTKSLFVRFLNDHSQDQESRDDEENVDSNEASMECFGKSVKNDHKGDSNCSEPVNIGPVL